MSKPDRPPTNRRDDIATLLRLAGKRPEVPRERMERVRETAHQRWQVEVRHRSRKRYAWITAALATAASLVLWVILPVLGPAEPEPTTVVESLRGTVASRSPEASNDRPLKLGDILVTGSTLQTSESSGAAVRLASGHSVRLDAATAVRLVSERSFELEQGAVYVDSGFAADSQDRSIVVRTPIALIEEIGTQFEVRLDDGSVRVRLREGAVVVRQGDRNHDVQAGGEIELTPDGSVTRREIAADGPAWDWIIGITPMLDLQGRTAREFLDWVSRERGWTLAFNDLEVARTAAEVELSGTARGLSVEEALDAVLPTCGMTYRLEDGILTVGSAD